MTDLPKLHRRPATWPLQLIALPAYVAIWAGWVALGRLTAFGSINLLPGIGPGLTVNTAITLPVGAEAYAAYALYVLFHPGAPARARTFAAWSAGAALLIGMGGQVAYHLMAAAGMTSAPWLITTFVSCLPVAVLGAAAALVYLIRAAETEGVSDGAGREGAEVGREDRAASGGGQERPGGDSEGARGDQARAEAVATDRSKVDRPRKPPPTSAERVVRAHRRTPDATHAELAKRLNLSLSTVKTHRPKPEQINGNVPTLVGAEQEG